MPADRHAETARGREFQVAGYPAAWAEWSFEAKVRWLIGNTAPRCSYGDACALLAGHRRRRREVAALDRRIRAEREHAASRRFADDEPDEHGNLF
jgi:hypothetical protein